VRTKKEKAPEANERTVGRIARNRMRIAWMYYVEGLTQSEIADSLGIGRVTVIRNINEAIKQHEVRIWITGHVAECIELEKELKDAFDLDEAVVVPEPSLSSHTSKVIGAAAGMYVTDQLRDNSSVGVGWGQTLHESLQTLAQKQLSNVEVVSLLGGIVQARRFNPAEFAWQFANIIDADCYLLTAPAIVDSARTKQALIEKCGLSDVIDKAAKLDMALLSVGNMLSSATSFRMGYLTEEDRKSLVEKGAVGDLLCNYFDLDGKIVKHPVNERVVSVPVDSIKAAKKRVMVSGGMDKIDALLGGMKLVNCNVLVTNEAAAQELLRRAAQK